MFRHNQERLKATNNYCKSMYLNLIYCINELATAVTQSVRAFASHADGWVIEFQSRQNRYWQVICQTLGNRWACRSNTLNRYPVSKYVRHAQWPPLSSISQNLKPFIGNGDVSIRWNMFRVWRKHSNKQKQIQVSWLKLNVKICWLLLYMLSQYAQTHMLDSYYEN